MLIQWGYFFILAPLQNGTINFRKNFIIPSFSRDLPAGIGGMSKKKLVRARERGENGISAPLQNGTINFLKNFIIPSFIFYLPLGIGGMSGKNLVCARARGEISLPC